MNRITEIEICGKKLPLNFSIAAARKICEKYTDLVKMVEEIPKLPLAKQLEEVIWILAIMLEQGAKYKEIFEGEEVRAYTQEELEIMMSVTDAVPAFQQLVAAITLGMESEIDVGGEKNATATQGSK